MVPSCGDGLGKVRRQGWVGGFCWPQRMPRREGRAPPPASGHLLGQRVGAVHPSFQSWFEAHFWAFPRI